MKIMANFKCSTCKRVVERRIENDVKKIECECEGVMIKMLSAPRCFNNTVGSSPASIY